MNQDRGLTAVIGIVFAFSLLWTIAVLVPDRSNDHAVQRGNRYQLIVNGTHYVFDADADQTGASAVEDVKIIHYHLPRIQKRKLGKRKNTSSSTSTQEPYPSQTVSQESTNKFASTNTTTKDETTKSSSLFPSYFYFILFIAYHARNLIRKRSRMPYEDDFFLKSGLEARLEYEDDFYSVDHSFYGTMQSTWSGEDFDKFDVDASSWDGGDLSLYEFDETAGTIKFCDV